MHEMSIATSIVDLAEDAMRANGGTVIHQVNVSIGALSTIEPSSLSFCFDAVTKGTAAEGAKLVMEIIPVKALCIDCGHEFMVKEHKYECPQCHSRLVKTVAGEELRVNSIDMD